MKKINLYILPVLLAFATCPVSWSQNNTINSVQLRHIRLENLQSKVDSIIAGAVAPFGPGLSIGILYQGLPVINSHYGLMNLDYQMPLSGSSAYNLASVSRHITAFGVLLLESEGKLHLNDEIGKYIPMADIAF